MAEPFVFEGGEGDGFNNGVFSSVFGGNTHLERGLKRLPWQFYDSVVYKEILKIFLEEFQQIEETISDIKRQKDIEYAEGKQLDLLGEYAGIMRPEGLSDFKYRKLIKLKRLANSSEGTYAEVKEILLLALEDSNVTIVPEYPAGFAFIPNVPVPNSEIMNIVASSVPITVKMATSSPFSTNPRFCFAGGSGAGFSDIDAPDGSGGQIRSRKEYS